MGHDHQTGPAEQSALRRYPFVLSGFLLVIGYFLLTEHRAHFIQFLPFLLLAACPLMHVFMHGGHRHGGGAQPGGSEGKGGTS